MKVLLDTNVPIKIGVGDRLPLWMPDRLVREDLYVSPLTRAEIALKVSVGKLPLPVPEEEFWSGLVGRLGARSVPFTEVYASRLAGMPPIHRDPFDRIIAAQCLAEDLVLASTDAVFAGYGVRLLSVS